MGRGILLLLSVFFVGAGVLTVVRAPTLATWKPALLVGEFGHVLWILPAALTVLARRSAGVDRPAALVGLFTVLLCLTAVGLLLKPTVQACALSRTLTAELGRAFGKVELTRSPFSLKGLLAWPSRLAIPQTLEFARAGTPNALALNFYAAQRADGRPAPCVLVIHGGGWDSGDRTQLPRFNGWLAQRGYAVAAIDYRLAPQHAWPAAADDVETALAFLKDNAARLGLDPQKFILLGRSAGGQIATAFAYGRLDPAVRGVVALYAPHDLHFAWQYGREDDILHSLQLLRQLTGGTPDTVRAAYDSASGYSLATKSAPPTLIVHGVIDTLVWHKQSERLHTRLDELGVPNVFVSLPWATHAFDYNLAGPGGQLTTYALEWFLAAVTK